MALRGLATITCGGGGELFFRVGRVKGLQGLTGRDRHGIGVDMGHIFLWLSMAFFLAIVFPVLFFKVNGLIAIILLIIAGVIAAEIEKILDQKHGIYHWH